MMSQKRKTSTIPEKPGKKKVTTIVNADDKNNDSLHLFRPRMKKSEIMEEIVKNLRLNNAKEINIYLTLYPYLVNEIYEGYTLLYLAISIKEDMFDTIILLLKKGANVNKNNTKICKIDGFMIKSPLDLAVLNKKYHLIRILILHGASASKSPISFMRNDKLIGYIINNNGQLIDNKCE